MVKDWKKFNESSETFTIEMAQEIIYYFGEDSIQSDDLKTIMSSLYNEYSFLEHIVMFEVGYDEINGYIDFIYKKAMEFPDFKANLINIYSLIRKEMGSFPEIYEIEDIYLNLIESDKFIFYVDVNAKDQILKIKLSKSSKEDNLNVFIKYCKLIQSSIDRLQGTKYRTKLDSCEYHPGYYNKFKIELKKYD
jgi:hypothetical protein